MKRSVRFIIIAFLSLFPASIVAGFAADTEVITAAGQKQIQELSLHEHVQTLGLHFCEIQSVYHMHSKREPAYSVIKISNGLLVDTIHCSCDQQFYVVDQSKWVKALELKSGDCLLSGTGQQMVVKSSTLVVQELECFDISVSKNHNFFVTRSAVLVHNAFPLIAVGFTWAFGGGIEFIGASVGIGILGGLLVKFGLRKSRCEHDPKEEPHFSSCGGIPPDDDDEFTYKLTFFKNDISHMFKDRPGHLADTPANRKLILDLASDEQNFLTFDEAGTAWYARTLSNGKQLWAQVRDNVIRNCGINEIVLEANPATGLSKLRKP